MKCFIDCSFVDASRTGLRRNLAPSGAITQVWKKMILWALLPLACILKRHHKCGVGDDANGEGEISADLPLPGRGVPEDDQRQVQAANRLGYEGWSQALWRDQNRPAAGFGRDFGNRAPRAQPRVEGAHRDRTDRPQGLRRRSSQGGISPEDRE